MILDLVISCSEIGSELNIWVLGTIGTKADKHIEWSYPNSWPNFADFDVLIINLESLYKSRMETFEYKKYLEASQTILDRICNGGIVIIITSPSYATKLKESSVYSSNYFLSSIDIDTQNVAEGTQIEYSEEHPFIQYLKQVKKFNFIITKRDTSVIESKLQILLRQRLLPLAKYHISDKAGHDIGFGFNVRSGEIIFLPPVIEISIHEGINKIIEIFKKPIEEKLETPPDWIKQVKLYSIGELTEKINQLNSQKTQLEEEISKKTNEKKILENFYNLLFAQNKQLENTVRDAFKILGFEEIRKIRNENDEDWVIDLTSIKNVEHGIIEVKGRNERTKHSDIVQCNKWVDDYHLMDPPKTTKGIFISNQSRLESYPESKDKRTKFEPNELEYAVSRKICIIPSYVLFEAINNFLQGKTKSREEIEKILYETNGILNKL